MNHFRTLHGTETVALKEDNFDECAFYFCSFFIDTTFGCVVTYWLLKGTMKLGDEGYVWPSWKTPGKYGNPPDYNIWRQQMCQWLLVTILMKSVVTGILFPFEKLWGEVGNFLFKPLQIFPKLELVIVMLVGPGCMNAFQFWVQDEFLKDKNVNNSEMLVSLDEEVGTVKTSLLPKNGNGNGNTKKVEKINYATLS